VQRLANSLSIESVDAPRQQGGQVKAYRESTSNLRNEAGADAAALECQDICETLHQVARLVSTPISTTSLRTLVRKAG
jgi:hypothetical protein